MALWGLALAALFPVAAVAQTCSNSFTGDNAGTFGTFPAPTSPSDYQFRNLTNAPSPSYSFATNGQPGASGQYLVTSGAFSNKIFGGGNHWANMVGHTSGASNDGFLAVNGSGIADQTFYSQTMNLPAGQTTIRVWAANAVVDPNTATWPNVGIRLINTATGVAVPGFDGATGLMPTRTGAPPTTQQWFPAEATAVLTAAGSYRVELYNKSTSAGGDDFIVDDITVTLTSQDCAKLTVIKTVVNDNGGTETATNFGIQSRAVRAGNSVAFAVPATVSGTTSTYISNTAEFMPDGGTEWLLELNRPAYTEGTWICTGDGVVQGATAFNNGGFTVARGRNATCRITNNDIPATLTVTKISNGGVNTFGFTGTNGFTAHSITTTTAGTGVAGPQRTLTTAAATTITEGAPPAGFVLTAIACTGMGTNGTATVDLNARNVALNAAAVAPGSNVACTFTNTARASLQLAKAWAAGSIAGDTVTIGASTGGANNTVAFNATAPNAGNSGAAVPVSVGDVITLPAEAGADIGNYNTALACTGGHTLSGTDGQQANTLTITSTNPAVCTYTNTSRDVDLSITKTNTPAAGPRDQANDTVDAARSTIYTLVVTNNSTSAVAGAIVRDAPGTGITCPPGNAVSISGDGVPAGAFTVADLTSASGIVLGSLGAAQSATLSFTCQVN